MYLRGLNKVFFFFLKLITLFNYMSNALRPYFYDACSSVSPVRSNNNYITMFINTLPCSSVFLLIVAIKSCMFLFLECPNGHPYFIDDVSVVLLSEFISTV